MTQIPCGGSSSAAPAEAAIPAATGSFMLTLCRLAAPVSIRPPQAPQLKRFSFFTSRVQHADGSDGLYLHMGYFASLTDARNCAQIMRVKYPGVTITPVQRAAESAASMSDTQVIRVLDTGRFSASQDNSIEANSAQTQISLVRPEDTTVLRTLKEAVAQRAPVAFAVQLQWSPQPIDARSVPSNSIFRAYTLYTTRGVSSGRLGHYLRLGFFNDATSAKQVGYYVRSSFPSVAVVPVVEQERDRANAERIDPETAYNPPVPAQAAKTPATQPPGPPPTSSVTLRERRGSLDETLEMLASSETWNDDSFSETGVRHLRVQVEKKRTRSS
jgi:hypothetical protein